jgi:hypothetical protein
MQSLLYDADGGFQDKDYQARKKLRRSHGHTVCMH